MSSSPFGSSGLDVARFWAVIGTSAVRDSGEVASALYDVSSRLATLALGDLTGFVERLHEALFHLDRKIFAQIPVVLRGVEFAQTGDHFLYARCACILAGEEVYVEVLRSGVGFTPFVSPSVQSAEGLLYVASKRYEEKAGASMDTTKFLSVESMSNVDGWAG